MGRYFAGGITAEVGGANLSRQPPGGLKAAVVTSPAPRDSRNVYVFDFQSTGSGQFNRTFTPQLSLNASTDYLTWVNTFRAQYFPTAGEGEKLIAELQASTGAANLQLVIEPGGILHVNDANGSNIADIGTLSLDTWYVVTIKCQIANSAQVKGFLDFQEVFDLAAQDTLAAGDHTNLRLLHQSYFQNTPGALKAWYLGESVVIGDDGADIDAENTALVDYLVYPPMEWAGNNDFGTAPDTGTYANLHEIPPNDTNDMTYSSVTSGSPKAGGVTCHDGTRAGPLNNADVDGTILGWILWWRAKKGGAFQNTVIKGKYGGTPSGSESTDNTTTTATFSGLTTSLLDFIFYRDASDGFTPTESEYLQLGVDVSTPFGTVSATVSEMAGIMVMEKPAAAGAIRDVIMSVGVVPWPRT